MDDYPWERGIDKISDIAKETETQKVVNIRTFIEGNEFLDQPPRTEFVYGEMEEILGYSSDPEKVFSHNRPIKEYIGLFGKGSGKSTMGFLMELYLIYLLLSMKDPLGFFKIPRTDYLSFVNVSVAGKQAKEEYFIRMKNCLQEAPYFKEHYNIYDSKSVVSKAGTESKGNIYMKSDVIDFPKGLKAVSVHSHNESWEGKNILFWVLDEASGFLSASGQYNADKIYNTLTTSVREFPYLGLILSFPRLDEEHDWTFRKLKEAENVEGMEGNQRATWEVKPSIFYCGKRIPFTFTMPDGNVMTVDVPVEYKKQASTDPQNFLSTYMAIPGAGGGTFFEGFNFEIRPEQRLPIFEIDTYIVKKEKKYINKKIIKQNYSIRGEKIVLTLDQSETNCMASIILGHKEKICDESGKIRILIVVDIIILYRPDPEEELVVDNDNYIELILDIIDKVGGVDLVRMDHWNAVNLKQKLEKKNISVSTKGPRKTSYEKTRSVLLYGRMSLPNQVEEIKELSNELKALDKPVGNSKPHVLYGFQDPADCLAQLVEELWDETSLDMSEIPVGNVIVTPMSPGELKMSGEKDRVERMFGLKDKVEQVLQKKYTKAKALDRRMGVGNVVSYGGGSGNKPSSSSSDIRKRLEEIGKG